MRSPLLCLIAAQALACTQPTPNKNKSPKPNTSAPSTQEAANTNTPSSEEAPTSTPTDLKLSMSATAPAIEPTPITPQKTDPECEAPAAVLSDTDKDALFNAYIEIQKEYLAREKGVKNFKLNKDPKEPLKYELSFVDIFGNAASMKYKFGKAISSKDDKTTLCLDEGAIMLWAGTYKRDPIKKFVPDL